MHVYLDSVVVPSCQACLTELKAAIVKHEKMIQNMVSVCVCVCVILW